jgi:anti-sigma factor RsiW
MRKLNDEILNKYIDGELDYSTLQDVNNVLLDSVEDKKQLQTLLAIHNGLKKLEEEHVSENFTNIVMNRLRLQKKSYKEQRTFVVVVSSIFMLLIIAVIGTVIYFGLSQSSNAERSISYSQNIIKFMQSVVLLMSQIFTPKGISIFGSVISLGILISGYFFFESLKATKQKIHKTN